MWFAGHACSEQGVERLYDSMYELHNGLEVLLHGGHAARGSAAK